nr:unnamed protein product [Callosobruchus chinensis]
MNHIQSFRPTISHYHEKQSLHDRNELLSECDACEEYRCHKKRAGEAREYYERDKGVSSDDSIIWIMLNEKEPNAKVPKMSKRPSTSITDSFSEDSDDSVQDQDYIVSSEFSSESEEVNDDFLNLDENDLSQKLSEERHNWKGRPKRGRRNKYPGQTSRSRKRLKDSNQSYYSVKGKLNESKPFLRNFQCQCAKKCHEVVSEEMREVLLKKYWDLGSYDLQTSFIGTTVQQFPVKRKRTKIVEGKSFTRVYLLNNINVCRNMFANIYRISTKRINTALKKVRTSQLKDQRGQKTTEGNPKVSFSFYKTTFYTHFNLRFKPPSKDTCNKCDQLKAQIESTMDGEGKESIKAVHKEHLLKAKLARSVMKTDLGKAKRHPNFEALTYDMEKVLGLPKLPTNEGVAGRGAQEVGSCLVKYINLHLKNGVEHLVLWSDSCGGQNRNLKTCVIMLPRCELLKEEIFAGRIIAFNESFVPVGTLQKRYPVAIIWHEGVARRSKTDIISTFHSFFLKHRDDGHIILWLDNCSAQNKNFGS